MAAEKHEQLTDSPCVTLSMIEPGGGLYRLENHPVATPCRFNSGPGTRGQNSILSLVMPGDRIEFCPLVPGPGTFVKLIT